MFEKDVLKCFEWNFTHGGKYADTLQRIISVNYPRAYISTFTVFRIMACFVGQSLSLFSASIITMKHVDVCNNDENQEMFETIEDKRSHSWD